MARTEYDRRRPRIPFELGRRIDAARGDVSFERWVREALARSVPAIPDPGTREAREQGCSCPTRANHNGFGAGPGPDGRRVFYFRFDCPLHGDGDWRDRNEGVWEWE